MENKDDIRLLNSEQLERFLINKNHEKYRADQILDWVWNKGIDSFSKMSNVSDDLKKLLNKKFVLKKPIGIKSYKSIDGTIKYSIQLFDKNLIEAVLIPTNKRVTACISSQVGCSLDCKFCATSRLIRKRNLFCYEIFDQLFFLNEQSKFYFKRKLSNVVFMGMGEPLLNYKNVIKAIKKIKLKSGLNFSSKKITISTSGIPKVIKYIAHEDLKCNLAVSLHSAIQKTREKIMPFSEKFPMEDLIDSLKYWYGVTKKKILYEYIIFDGINDNIEHVKALVKLCKIIPSKVNFIEYNPTDDKNFKQCKVEKLELYQKYLTGEGIVNTYRISRGRDINAACGQLINLNKVN
tara:strand:- start:488 stop:1534 length:1047 start_codon:yes stop_codon:yes gene_type:complete